MKTTVFMYIKNKLLLFLYFSILRVSIYETDEIQNLTDDNLVWLPSIYPYIKRLDIIGKTTELLLVTMDRGLGVMVPGLMELLDVNVDEKTQVYRLWFQCMIVFITLFNNIMCAMLIIIFIKKNKHWVLYVPERSPYM